MTVIDCDKPVQQRNGRDAIVYTVSGKNHDYPVVGEAIDSDEVWIPSTWSLDGCGMRGRCRSSDLVNVPQKHTGFLNLYPSFPDIHDNRAKADRMQQPGRIACIEVTFTEGEGLDNEA